MTSSTSISDAISGENSIIGVILLDEKQLADVVGIPVATLRYHRHKKVGIPFVKIGGTVRYRSDDIQAHLKQSRVSTSQVA